jgi:hypothetical protein
MRTRTDSDSVLPMSVSLGGGGGRLQVEFDGDPTLLAEFEAAWQRQPRKTQAAFKRFVVARAKGSMPSLRDRAGTFNPRVPSAVHARFREACLAAKPPITQIDAIKLVLNRYINVTAGARRTLRDQDDRAVLDHYGQRRKRAPGREELENPVLGTSPKERMQVDLGAKLKAVVEDLITDVGIGKSRFFAYLLFEAASEIERNAPDTRTSNGLAFSVSSSPGRMSRA